MATTKQWIAGARPRTLPMAVAPVLIGAAAVFAQPYRFNWFAGEGGPEEIFAGIIGLQLGVALLALIVSLALQVGVNYANDYSDGVRGTDDERVGPMRLTGSGAAAPRQVKAAAFGSFGVAGLAGLIIVVLTEQWWLIGAGALCVLAAWWYTGGSKPYGYMGLGEVMVFVFFGLVATLGTSYALVEAASARGVTVGFPLAEALVGAVSHGLIASALLMANNVRDIPTDRESGKMTLAVRLGETRARRSYVLMMGLAAALPLVLVWSSPLFLVAALGLLGLWRSSRTPGGALHTMLDPGAVGPALIPVLQRTGVNGILFALMYSTLLIGAGLS